MPGKRFDVLLRSVAALPGAWLLLVGEGPERAALERLARQLGVPDRVLLPGASGGEGPAGADGGAPVPGLPGLLAAMDVFASPSGEETFGISVLEALAAGLPVRHVTCPAIDELPAAEAPGARRVGASTAELTAELRGLRAADAYRLPVPAAVRRYDIGRTAERLMAVYTRLAGAAARPDAPSGRLTAPAERLTGSRGRPTPRGEQMSTEPTEPAPPDGAAPGRLARLRARLAPSRVAAPAPGAARCPPGGPSRCACCWGRAAGAGYGLLKAPQYTATSYVVVVPTAHTDPATALGFAQAYGRVAVNGAVLREARPAAGLPLSTLQSAVRSATSPDAPMIEISATAARPGRAAVVANAVSRALTRHGNHSAERTTVRLLSFARATPPPGPPRPR